MSSVVVVECKTLSGCAHVYQHSASYDLWAGDTKTVKTQDREVIRLDLAVAIPERCYGRIAARYGWAKCGIVVLDGMTDSDCRGDVWVVFFNLSNEEYIVRTGNRIAQLIIEEYIAPKFVLVNEFTKRDMERRKKGFGSSGGF